MCMQWIHLQANTVPRILTYVEKPNAWDSERWKQNDGRQRGTKRRITRERKKSQHQPSPQTFLDSLSILWPRMFFIFLHCCNIITSFHHNMLLTSATTTTTQPTKCIWIFFSLLSLSHALFWLKLHRAQQWHNGQQRKKLATATHTRMGIIRTLALTSYAFQCNEMCP